MACNEFSNYSIGEGFQAIMRITDNNPTSAQQPETIVHVAVGGSSPIDDDIFSCYHFKVEANGHWWIM